MGIIGYPNLVNLMVFVPVFFGFLFRETICSGHVTGHHWPWRSRLWCQLQPAFCLALLCQDICSSGSCARLLQDSLQKRAQGGARLKPGQDARDRDFFVAKETLELRSYSSPPNVSAQGISAVPPAPAEPAELAGTEGVAGGRDIAFDVWSTPCD